VKAVRLCLISKPLLNSPSSQRSRQSSNELHSLTGLAACSRVVSCHVRLYCLLYEQKQICKSICARTHHKHTNTSTMLAHYEFDPDIVFFARASAIMKHVLAIGWTSVRPSVRLFVTRWYCIKTAEHIVMLSSPRDSPFILVLCISRSSQNSVGVTPCGGAKQRWGMKISQF